MSKIKTFYKFEEGNLSIPFDKILLITTEVTDPDELPEQFHTDEDVYNLTIKQQNSSSLTRIIVLESIYKNFENKYHDYLDYKLKNSAIENEVNAQLLKEAAQFFESLNSKVEATLLQTTKTAEEQLAVARKEVIAVISEAELINRDASENLSNFNQLQKTIENFVLEEEEVETVTGEILPKEEKNVESEESVETITE